MREGQIIGQSYRIVRKVGEGGFGDVYLAQRVQDGCSVAIKVSRRQENPLLPDYLQRFEREVALARKLSHPNVVRIFDHGSLGDGMLYMVMEYVAGVEVEQVLRREGRLSLARSTQVILQVLDALAEAHGQGVVHRDLKPSNIMLCPLGLRNDVVKLLDFGVAKAFDGTYADLTAQNLTGGVGFGTPQYMAPEQILGQGIGPHSDLYAVGLIFAELLTGVSLMMGATPTETIRRQLEEVVVLPPQLRVAPLEGVLRRSLAKDWTMRYGSAHEMYRDLERLLIAPWEAEMERLVWGQDGFRSSVSGVAALAVGDDLGGGGLTAPSLVPSPEPREDFAWASAPTAMVRGGVEAAGPLVVGPSQVASPTIRVGAELRPGVAPLALGPAPGVQLGMLPKVLWWMVGVVFLVVLVMSLLLLLL